MQRQLRVLCAAIEADAAFVLLDQHKKEFAGTEWMPKNFFQRKRIIYMLQRVEATYTAFEKVDFTGLPGESVMVKARNKMWLDLTLAKKWQVRDHMRFLQYISDVLQGARGILERLRRLAITGQIVRTGPPTEDPFADLSLLD
jgi:hypothetical protein